MPTAPPHTVGRMPLARLFAAALIAGALTPVGQAAAQPAFPHSYHGTISGTFDAHDSFQGTTIKASWTIKGVRLRYPTVAEGLASSAIAA